MLLNEKLKPYKIILGSQSPRRSELLHLLGINFEVKTQNAEEDFPSNIDAKDVPQFLAQKKAAAYINELNNNTLVITADTIVYLNGEIINKPTDRNDAINILQKLSNNRHTVYSGVCITSAHKTISFTVASNVYFKKLTFEEIEYYIDNFKPYDKAGAYGVQDWIGLVGIEKIDGSFHNIMGLPVKELYEQLMLF
ncbi:MAG TPA: Maf family nucleotide pyrophosphatase [Bacteroidia bacterium]|nr:septum formation protein Maf [Bacteroidota bacterium]MBL0050014.1 septum formation protein Maf [Bacteroidota bacterium]HRC33573.1 Maf family nucleotide pyrophosphatase [Bacteroidia bacterium]